VKSALEDASESPGPTDLAPAPWPDYAPRRASRERVSRPLAEAPVSAAAAPTRVYSFGIPRPSIEEVAEELSARVTVLTSVEDADIFVTTKAHYSRRPTAVRNAERGGTPVYVLRRGSREQIRQFLRRFANGGRDNARHEPEEDAVSEALAEAEEGARRVLAGERRVELSPQSAHVRRLQHGLARRYNLASSSTGHDPVRRVVVRTRQG